MLSHPNCKGIDVASRGVPENDHFFYHMNTDLIHVLSVNKDFRINKRAHIFGKKLRLAHPGEYDWVILRMPKPNPVSFFRHIEEIWGDERVINRPSKIAEIGSKAYLLNFPDLCPPMKLCYHLSEILALKKKYSIVLKPLFDSGGRGILRIENNTVWEGNQTLSLEAFLPKLEWEARNGYLAMKYLPKVHIGDKRIIVVDGEITGSALRLPKENSWLCNAYQGGCTVAAEPDTDEIKIIEKLHPVMQEKGIVLYGIDTLVGDNGKRQLSEINASNAGGMLPAEQVSGEPVIKKTSDALWRYLLKN